VDLEVRALFPQNGSVVEDPVTGSLNASAAGWLLDTGRLAAPYTARQGTAIGRNGRIEISRDADGTVWTGGRSATLVAGTVDL
jgi:predicted PhzF superfamily epimerase YddE/YHI9